MPVTRAWGRGMTEVGRPPLGGGRMGAGSASRAALGNPRALPAQRRLFLLLPLEVAVCPLE